MSKQTAAQVAEIEMEISAEEQDRIREEEVKKYAAEQLDAKKKAFRDEVGRTLRVGRAKAKPGEKMVEIEIEVPPFADGLVIDGRTLVHGKTIPIPESQVASFQEIMFRAWTHEDQIHGGMDRSLKRQRTIRLGMMGGQARAV